MSPKAVVQNHGTLSLVHPMDGVAREWLESNTDGTWFGGKLVVEHRFVGDLIRGMAEAGIDVSYKVIEQHS